MPFVPVNTHNYCMVNGFWLSGKGYQAKAILNYNVVQLLFSTVFAFIEAT